jgi:cobalt-zinc-cadmium efflux system outer membrane protein
MKPSQSWFFLLVLCGLLPVAANTSLAGETAKNQLDDLVTEALDRNPDLRAAEARWKMAEHKVIPAGSLDDPRFGFALSNYPVNSFSGDETPMTGKEFQLSQMLPFPGKLGSKKEMAAQQAEWFRRLYEDARLQLVRQVKDAWYQVYFQQQAIAITHENVAILDDFIRLTETRYEVGTGLQQDVLKAQVERSKLLDRLFNLQQQLTTSLADFNRLLSRAADTPVETPRELEPTPVVGDLQEFVNESRTYRPLFAGYQAMIDRYRAQRKLAKLDYYPDVDLWAGYRQREDVPGDPAEGIDFVSAGFSINIPLWQGKRREAVAEAESGVRMALRQLEDIGNRIDFTISDQYARLTKNRDLVELFKTGIIPQAEQSFEATLSAYQVGDVDFLNLLDSQLTLYRYRIDYYRALSDYQRSVAGLEAAVGKELGGEKP